MSAWIVAGYLDADSLQKVVQDVTRNGVWFILESRESLRLGCIEAIEGDVLETIAPIAQEEGRLFASDFELRWQRLCAYPPYRYPFRARLITEDQALLNKVAPRGWQSPAGVEVTSQQLDNDGAKEIYLWGELVASSSEPYRWYEKEVPQMFCYPVKMLGSTRRVKLEIISYRLAEQSVTDLGGETENCPDEAMRISEPVHLQRFAGFQAAE